MFGLEIPIIAAIVTGVCGVGGAIGAALLTLRRTQKQNYKQQELQAAHKVIPEINRHLNDIRLNFFILINPSTSPVKARRAGKSIGISLSELNEVWSQYTYLFTDEDLRNRFIQIFNKFSNHYEEVSTVLDQPGHPHYQDILESAGHWLESYTEEEHDELNNCFAKITGTARRRLPLRSTRSRPMLPPRRAQSPQQQLGSSSSKKGGHGRS